jgi:uncharacterized membrane protein (DUF2068 family)
MKKSDRRMIRGIALFKLAKAALMVTVGVVALRLVHTDIAGFLEELVPRLGFEPASHHLGRLMLEATKLTPTRIREVGAGSFLYGALFLTEGLGLWFYKKWAEWMTILLTSSLLPVEIWEIFKHPNGWKVAVLMVNLALVGYLIYLVRKERGVVE